MKKLLVYMKGYLKECILGPLFKLFEATLELFVPLMVAAVIDKGISLNNNGYIVKMCVCLVLIGFVSLLASVTAQYFAAKAAVSFTARIKRVLFSHITELSYNQTDKIDTSTLITRMTSDMNQVQTGVNLTLRLLLRSPFVVFGAMIMAFTVDTKAALIFTVAIPMLSIVVFGIMLISIPLYKRVRSSLDSIMLRVRENLTGVRVIRAFHKEDEEVDSFKNENDTLTRVQILVGRISSLMNPVTFIIINLSVIALVYTGAIQVNMGLLTQGAVVALYNYMSQILVELIKLADLIINITKSIACGNRIAAVLEIENDQHITEDTAINSPDAVCFENVELCYNQSAEASLSNISFSAEKCETIGIIGATGSGKSSLVNLIPRFYDATNGCVSVNGCNVQSMPIDELRALIGIVPQKAVLFKGTIRSNLLMGNENATDEDLLSALKSAQALDFVTAKPKGLDSEVEQGGRNLSGGQRQRLTIARALVKNPEILILDDSASALDFATDAALREAIKQLPWNPTVFIVSQRTSSIQHANKIIVLDDGVTVGIGTHEQLLENCTVYKEIHDSQFKKEAATNG